MQFLVSSRTVGVCMLCAIAAAVACRYLPSDRTTGALLATLTATVAVGVVPGALVTLLWQPRSVLSVLELAGFGIAISFGVVHVLTILAVSAHVGPLAVLAFLGVVALLVGGRVIHRSSGAVVIGLDEAIVIGVLIVLGSCLYVVGAPIDSSEDQIHAAIVRRLSQLPAPALDNLYVTPRTVYTYPFPGTHYFMALVARLGDIDALFVYHKLRFFWGTTAVLMLYLIAGTIFEARAVACAAALTAGVLVLSGTFAMGFPTGWGQLAPYSHASDIAMTVLLPSLLAVALAYMHGTSRRERAFFLTASGFLILMLTMVHIREIVQFAAYLGCFAIVTAMMRRFRPYFGRTLVLLAVTLAVAVIYTRWQAWLAPLVHDIVQTEREGLLSLASASTITDLLIAPASSELGDFLQKTDQIFRDLLPFFLFAGPATIVLFGSRPLVWLVASSTTAYLVVMSVPLLAVPYIYLTYFEILHWPVRNIIFFVYALAGVPLYAAVLAFARTPLPRLGPLATGVLGGALALLATLCLNRSHLGFFVPLIAVYALTFIVGTAGAPLRRVGMRHLTAAVLGVAVLLMLWPDHSAAPRSEQVTIRWTSGLPDERRTALERQFSLLQAEPKPERTGELNVWNYRLTALSADNVRTLVEHPDVVDTHFIDRATFAVESQPPPGDNQPMGVTYVKWMQYPAMPLLFATTLLVWALAVAVPVALASAAGDRALASLESAVREPFHRHALAYALCIVPFAMWSARPAISPLVAAAERPSGGWTTPLVMTTQLPCIDAPSMQARFTEHLFPDDPEDKVMLPARTMCPPGPGLIEWIQTNVPVQAVFAIDRWDPFPPAMFSPQQMVVFPTLDASFISEDRLFGEYYQWFYDRMRQYREQPFFNARETPQERIAFVRAMGVTHILVNPTHYDALRSVLDGLKDQYTLKYDRERWAVYEVNGRNGASGVARAIR